MRKKAEVEGVQIDLEDLIGRHVRAHPKGRQQDEFGREVPSPVPMAPPLGYRKQPTITERIRDMVRSENLRLEAARAGYETFEEGDDFDIGDDYDPRSPYELQFDPGPAPDKAPVSPPVASGAGPLPEEGDGDQDAPVASGEAPLPAVVAAPKARKK